MILLRSLLQKAVDRDVLGAVPKFPERLTVAPLMLELNAEEEHKFLDAFDDHGAFFVHYHDPKFRNSMTPENLDVLFSWFRASKPFFILALHTGLRKSDLINLQWSAVDLKEKHIKLSTSKTSAPVCIPLSPTAVAALQERRGRKMSSATWVFTQQDGTRFSESTFRDHFVTASCPLSHEGSRPHDMRHTAACKLASAGVSLFVISKILSHSSSQITEKVYARAQRLAPGVVDAIVSGMER
jgi:integrase